MNFDLKALEPLDLPPLEQLSQDELENLVEVRERQLMDAITALVAKNLMDSVTKHKGS